MNNFRRSSWRVCIYVLGVSICMCIGVEFCKCVSVYWKHRIHGMDTYVHYIHNSCTHRHIRWNEHARMDSYIQTSIHTKWHDHITIYTYICWYICTWLEKCASKHKWNDMNLCFLMVGAHGCTCSYIGKYVYVCLYQYKYVSMCISICVWQVQLQKLKKFKSALWTTLSKFTGNH